MREQPSAAPIVQQRFERTVILQALILITFLAFTASVLAWLGRLPYWHDELPVLSHFARINLPVTGAGTVLFALMTLAFRQGADWPLTISPLVTAITVIPTMRPELFSYGVPQLVWVPTLVALALCSLHMTVMTALLSLGLTLFFHGSSPGVHNGPSAFGSAIILSLIILVRVLYEHSVTVERKQSQQIHDLALFDALTALPNRRLLMDRLLEGMKRSKRRNLSLAVLFIDLDRFKEVNDTLGHKAGDLLLMEAAQRILSCVRSSDTVSRFGGDEFVLVLSEVADRSAVGRIAGHINERLAAAFDLPEKRVFVSGSVGIAFYPDDTEDAETLLKHADQALYQSKRSGRSRYTFYTPALQAVAEKRAKLLDDLRTALATRQHLELHYQPILSLRTGEALKAEALVRWHHPELGPVSPGEFIPLAETSGLIHALGEWVLAEAAERVTVLRRGVSDAFQVSVNWSPVQFRTTGEKPCTWRERIDKLGVSGDGLALEITEGVLVDNTTHSQAQFECLRRAGIGLSIDDFGTGYSSLAYLQRYTIDYLKIDRSFVGTLATDARTRTLCKAMIAMAHELGMQVIAEGVETAEQHAFLEAAGADYGQGFYYAMPMSADDLSVWLAEAGRTEIALAS